MSDLSNTPHPPRGGAPVGQMAELDPFEAAVVIYFRMWSDGEHGIAQMRSDFTRTLGIPQGQEALSAFDTLCSQCARFGRRPLMRHHLTCACLGGDESCFANLVAVAGQGEREDAAILASLMVRADLALPVADLATEVALYLRRMLLTAERPDRTKLH